MFWIISILTNTTLTGEEKENDFMRRSILELVPKRFLCPYCGEWHEMISFCGKLGGYDKSNKLILHCTKNPYPRGNIVTNRYYDWGEKGRYIVWFSYSDCYCYVERPCDLINKPYVLEKEFSISKIEESDNLPVITYQLMEYTTAWSADWSCCRKKCPFERNCRLASLNNDDSMILLKHRFGFEFDKDEYFKPKQSNKPEVKQVEQSNKPKVKQIDYAKLMCKDKYCSINDVGIEITCKSESKQDKYAKLVYKSKYYSINDVGNV